MPTLTITDPNTGQKKVVHLSGTGPVTQQDIDDADAIAFPKTAAPHYSTTQPRTDSGQFNGPPSAPTAPVASTRSAAQFTPPSGFDATIPGLGSGSFSVSEVPQTPSDPTAQFTNPFADSRGGAGLDPASLIASAGNTGSPVPPPNVSDSLLFSQAPLRGVAYGQVQNDQGNPPDPATLLMPQGNDTPPIASQDTSAPVPAQAQEPPFLDRVKALLSPSDELARQQEAQTHEAFLPPVSTEGAVAAYGTNALKNAFQGSEAPGLQRFEQDDQAAQAAGASPSSSALDILGHVFDPRHAVSDLKAGWDAMTANDGDQRIGAQVPALAPSTGAGMAYNAGVAVGTDPYALATGAAAETAATPIQQIMGMLTKRLFPGADAPVPAASGNPFRVPDAPVSSGLNAADPLSVGAGNVPGYAPSASAPTAPLSGQAIAPSAATGSPAPVVFRRTTPEPGQVAPSSVPAFSPDFSDLSAKPYAPSSPTGNGSGAGTLPPLESFANTTPVPTSNPFRVGAAKVGRGALDVLNLPRSIKLSGDMSAGVRQAPMLAAGNPLAALRSTWKAASNLSGARYARFGESLARSPMAAERQYGGLYLSSTIGKGAALGQREEAFASNLANRIPGVAQSHRAYSVFLDSLRADSFDRMAGALRQSVDAGTMTQEQYSEGLKAIGNYVNLASGRGNLGKLEPAADAMGAVLFSPRALSARFQVLDPRVYAALPGPARVQALRNLGAYVGSGMATMALIEHAGGKADLDPSSPTFGSIQFPHSNVTLDFWGGYGSAARLVGQTITGKRVTASGYRKPLDGSGRYPETRLSNAGAWAENQLAPGPHGVLDVARGHTAYGIKAAPGQEVGEAFTPIVVDGLRNAIHADGVKGAAYLPMAALGVGLKQAHGDDGGKK